MIKEILNNLRGVGYEIEEMEVASCFEMAWEILECSYVDTEIPALTVIIEDILFNDDRYFRELMKEEMK